MTTLSTYLNIANNLTKWDQITASSPAVATATKYFQANIGSVTSIDQLLSNTRLFNYAMTAFGLGNMTYAKGMMKQVLQQGVTSSTALANTLNNPNILAFAKAFNFAANGAATTQSATLQTSVVNAYIQTTLDTNAGQQNPGVQLALYFQQNAPNVTNVYGLLADKKLLTVVQTALGISSLTSAENIDIQAQMLEKKINISDFQDPKKLQSFIARFSAMYDYSNAANGTAPPSPASLTNAILYQPSQSGISLTLLQSLQGLHLGGS